LHQAAQINHFCQCSLMTVATSCASQRRQTYVSTEDGRGNSQAHGGAYREAE
jgi:hypothetical protein